MMTSSFSHDALRAGIVHSQNINATASVVVGTSKRAHRFSLFVMATDSVETILSHIPIPFRKKAKALLEHIQLQPNMGWNEKLTLVLKGKPIKRTNMVELIKDALRLLKFSHANEWELFARALRKSHVDKGLIANSQFLKRDSYTEKEKRPKTAILSLALEAPLDALTLEKGNLTTYLTKSKQSSLGKRKFDFFDSCPGISSHKKCKSWKTSATI